MEYKRNDIPQKLITTYKNKYSIIKQNKQKLIQNICKHFFNDKRT